ncbi:MAG: hypothetical protein ACE5E6_10575 [Phycisphaerae bacterium]
MGDGSRRARRAAAALVMLVAAGCGDFVLNQTASLGGSSPGSRGSVRVVFINNTPHRAVFTAGGFDPADQAFAPEDFVQFSSGGGGMTLDGDSQSDILTMTCARVVGVGSPTLLELIDRNLPDAEVDAAAFVTGVRFVNGDAGDEPVGTAPPLEALIGVDFPCNALLIFRLEFDDSPGGDPFRVDFDVIPAASSR